MIAAQRFRGLGWFVAGVIAALGFYLVSLQVAAERGKLEAADRAIVAAHRDIRALETEFDTRANLAQLEEWNGSVLALTAPTAAQFLPDQAALARLDQTQPGAARVETAALLVPSGIQPVAAGATVAPATAAPQAIEVASAPVAVPTQVAALTRAAASTRTAPMTRGAATMAMLDRKLLSDSMLGDLMSSARLETGSPR